MGSEVGFLLLWLSKVACFWQQECPFCDSETNTRCCGIRLGAQSKHSLAYVAS